MKRLTSSNYPPEFRKLFILFILVCWIVLKYAVFTATVLFIFSLLGLIGAFALIKYPLSRGLGLTESFLGKMKIITSTLDGLTFLGRFIGSLYSLFFPY